jgi:hypothetical protein
VRDFRAGFAPLLDVVWVDAMLHDGGLDLLLERQKRSLSPVDAFRSSPCANATSTMPSLSIRTMSRKGFRSSTEDGYRAASALRRLATEAEPLECR